MKKRILLYVLCALLASPMAAKCDEPVRRGLFVTVLQEPQVLSSREEIGKLVDFAKRARINVIFVQVYYANRAWFPSKAADRGPYDACVKKLSADPLRLLITQAHGAGIGVHAWMNMLSLGGNKDAGLLKKYGTGILTRNLKEKRGIEDYKIDGQYFLEPGDTRVREELLNVAEEIVRAYPDLDGVQFDYIRYPDQHPAYGYADMNVERFKKATGLAAIDEKSIAWQDWKRAQVTELLEQLAERVRSIRQGIEISATGCMPYSRAYLEAFQDWPSWLERHLVDFITVMSYSPDPAELKRWITTAKSKTADFRKVTIGLGAYKLVRSPGAFEREFRDCEKAGAGGCAIFHYGSLLKNAALGDFLAGGRK